MQDLKSDTFAWYVNSYSENMFHFIPTFYTIVKKKITFKRIDLIKLKRYRSNSYVLKYFEKVISV